VRGDSHVETDFAGQTLMMSIAQGKYYAVDATAKRIWDMLERPLRLQEVVAALLDEFDVAPEQCNREVLAFAENLLRNGLIKEVPA
jgi:hypothetical protein